MISLILFFFIEKFYKKSSCMTIFQTVFEKINSLLSGGKKTVETRVELQLLLLNPLPWEPSKINTQRNRESSSAAALVCCEAPCLPARCWGQPAPQAAPRSPRRCWCCPWTDSARWHCHAPRPVSRHLTLLAALPVTTSRCRTTLPESRLLWWHGRKLETGTRLLPFEGCCWEV